LIVGEAAERPTTWASAIRIGEPAHAEHVASLVASGRVEVLSLSEQQLADAWQAVARTEGVFCEPASAAGVAALKRVGSLDGLVAVAILTGHGLKDPDAVADGAQDVVEPTVEAVLAVLG
jgi:threonine synthase